MSDLTKLVGMAARLRASSESVGGWPIMEEAARALESLTALQEEVETLRNAIDCACNALTDSICASGNDAETNLRWVKKLRALQQHTGESNA